MVAISRSSYKIVVLCIRVCTCQGTAAVHQGRSDLCDTHPPVNTMLRTTNMSVFRNHMINTASRKNQALVLNSVN